VIDTTFEGLVAVHAQLACVVTCTLPVDAAVPTVALDAGKLYVQDGDGPTVR